MITNKNVNSFTIQEILITLIITAILVGIAFSVLRMVQKHFLAIQRHVSANTASVQLEKALWIDMNKYTIAEYDDIQSMLKLKSEIDSTSYYFSGHHILKSRDTFNILMESKSFYFDGDLVHSGPIDALKLVLGKNSTKKTLFIYKRNDANQFIK